jgi:tetratricopeptide (TPR) repeat protein
VRLAGLVLAVAIVAAYVTSFGGTWVFDDLMAISENPTIRYPAQLDHVLLLPGDEAGTVGGRPVVNLTLALNYAIGGLDPRGYHAVNLAIHVLAAVTLFGLARRTLLRLPRFAASAAPLAFAVAALWALHPLQTEAVTYVVQRVESLCGLCYLLTLYCFVRSVDSPRPRRWQIAAVAACLAGMGSKEVMASAPLLVLLYDRTFVAGSWREAWRRRGGLHGALFATWLLLGVLVAGTAGRGGTAGFATAVSWWQYALTQCHAIVHYLRLALWPYPLVFDYGTPLYPFSAVIPQALLLLGLLGATVWALVRRPALGFLGAWFFLILAPSSSIVPVATQTMAEHRMYLPLAAVLALLVLGVHALGGRRVLPAGLALAAGAGVLTGFRNVDYHSELALWGDTVAHCPENFRAHNNLGIALTLAGRLPEAEAQFRETLRLRPDNADAHLNLCHVLGQLGRPDEAAAHGETAVRLEPDTAAAHINYAEVLEQLGRLDEAAVHYERGLQLEPRAPNVPARLAGVLYKLGNQAAERSDFTGAIARYRRVLELADDHVPARNNLANALFMAGRMDEAIANYREILRRDPTNQRVQENLARALELRR